MSHIWFDLVSPSHQGLGSMFLMFSATHGPLCPGADFLHLREQLQYHASYLHISPSGNPPSPPQKCLGSQHPELNDLPILKANTVTRGIELCSFTVV